MPELPEVETVARHLKPEVVGRTIKSFEALWHKVNLPMSGDEFGDKVIGRTIADVTRRGKYILLILDRGHVHIHLRMTGRIIVVPPVVNVPKHIRAQFDLSGERRLLFNDPRKFGRIGYIDSMDALDDKLGPEPLSTSFTAGRLYAMLQSHKRQMKPLLLDQAFIAGLGNIYVDEALFAARIHPLSNSNRVSRPKVNLLYAAIQKILQTAIDNHGTTFQNFAFGASQSGGYAIKLQVFGREGEPCPICNREITKTWVGQRGTHTCSHCQRQV